MNNSRRPSASSNHSVLVHSTPQTSSRNSTPNPVAVQQQRVHFRENINSPQASIICNGSSSHPIQNNQFYPRNSENKYPSRTNHEDYEYSQQLPSNQNQVDPVKRLQVLHRQQQIQEQGPTPVPFYIWGIEIIDILVLFWYCFLAKTSYAPFENFGEYMSLLRFLGILIRFCMALCLLIGLQGKDDYNVLWYCKIWLMFQLLLLLQSGFWVTVISILLNSQRYGHMVEVDWTDFGMLVYRLVGLILMWLFTLKLKKAESDRYIGVNGLSEILQQEQRERTQEASYIDPFWLILPH